MSQAPGRATLQKRPAEVAAMFDGVAPRYDLTNDVLSLGQDRWWRRAVARAVRARPGERVLDLAAGTGTSAEPFARAGASVIACDFSLGMLQAGRARRPGLVFVAGDALSLPFRDETFDAVTMSFGLRNVADVDGALAEMRRVTRADGRLVICEFSHPSNPLLRVGYLNYFLRALPAIARRVATNTDAYTYLAESIRAWPDAPSLASRVAAAGWRRVGWQPLSAGVVVLHTARR